MREGDFPTGKFKFSGADATTAYLNSVFHPFWVDKWVVSCNWMFAASVAAVVTSGERHEGKAGMVLFAGKTVWSVPERFVCTYLVQKGAI